MKRIFYFLLISISTFILSCEKNKQVAYDVSGKWKYDSVHIIERNDGPDAEYTTRFITDFLELKMDGTMRRYSYGSDEYGTWKREGDRLKLQNDATGLSDFNIVKLNDTLLVLHQKNQFSARESLEETYYLRRYF